MPPSFPDLMARVAANDKEIEHINGRARPNGSQWLASAELVARDLKGFRQQEIDVPRLTQRVRLPAFEFKQNGGYAWPRQ